MDVLLSVVWAGALVAAALVVWFGPVLVRRRAELDMVEMSLGDAPEPYWSEIRETLDRTRMVSPAALQEGCRRWPAVPVSAP
jgi:hypothetical protein